MLYNNERRNLAGVCDFRKGEFAFSIEKISFYDQKILGFLHAKFFFFKTIIYR